MRSRILKRFDWPLLALIITLVILGLSFIYSASLSLDSQKQLLITQGLAAFFGLVGLFLLARLDYQLFHNWARVIYVLTIIFLLAVLIFGGETRGTRAWFDLGFFRLQPSEFAKIAIVIVLAKYFSEHRTALHEFRHLVISFIYTLIPVGLVLVEPDLGSALIMLSIWAGMYLMVGIKRWHFLIFLTGFLLTGALAWNFVLADYQKDRITTFLSPAKNCQSVAAYNVCQSYIAIGSGGVMGRGFGQGTQSQLNFLPEKHTDFIFAVIAEELGFIGFIFVVAVFGGLLFRIFRISQQARDNFGLFLALGFGILILVEMVVNMGANLGVLPVTGVTLPLVSYGGSSLVATLLSLGVVLSVYGRRKKQIFS